MHLIGFAKHWPRKTRTGTTQLNLTESTTSTDIPKSLRVVLCLSWLILFPLHSARADENAHETLPQITARLAKETAAAYDACPFSALSKDYFNRFSRDPRAKSDDDETVLDANWQIVLAHGSSEESRLMATHLQTFLSKRMDVALPIETRDRAEIEQRTAPTLVLLESGGGDVGTKESFTIRVDAHRVTVAGESPNGLRDGVVRLVDEIGFREAPYLRRGSTTYKPRAPLRLGAVPCSGSYKDLVFFGFNAVLYGGGDLYALSTSDAIPELAVRRVPGMLAANRAGMREAGQYGLKAYAWLNTRQKFPKDDPVFRAHPEIRGALTWSADGEYTLCTSHPLVRRYLRESVQGMFRALPELHGIVLIIGGEGFYHCYMHPFGAAKGHTNCPRCEKLGAETAVADLCNDLTSAVREVRPDAEVVLWPYSAEHVWAADFAVTRFLEKLKPGTAVLTEIEKSEVVSKPGGVQKSIWDYSIDFIGPAKRTQQQITVCNRRGIPVYLKSEPELGFEAPRLPQIPCLDRWADRAEALVSCGAKGAWVFPAFRPFYGTTAAEINKAVWWSPVADRESALRALAQRVAGKAAAPKLRDAWRACSEAITYSPEIPGYYTGPYYLGPLHPMCANPSAPLPDVFFGNYLFHAEIKDSEGLKKEPVFFTSPPVNTPVFAAYYRQMKQSLTRAAEDVKQAKPLVDERHRVMFDAEAGPVLWFYHTARTHSNFYESCRLRDAVAALSKKHALSPADKAKASEQIAAWKAILIDELENTRAAAPLVERDMRLDCYYGGDHTFPHAERMIAAKLVILQQEINEYLPALAKTFAR